MLKLLKYYYILVVFAFISIYTGINLISDPRATVLPSQAVPNLEEQIERSSLISQIEQYLDREMIFVVGAKGSGTSLMRLLLDVHPQVNCGDETVLPNLFLRFISENVMENRQILTRFKNVNLRNETIKKAAALFLYFLMESNKKNDQVDTNRVRYICDAEPENGKYVKFLLEIFPNAKLVFMVRDGRDAAYSIRRGILSGASNDWWFDFDLSMQQWNLVNEIAFGSCKSIGPSKCQMVRYEKLVDNPKNVLAGLMRFLFLPWVQDLLHVENYLQKGKLNASIESIAEFRLANKGNRSWRGKIPGYKRDQYVKKYPMLVKLGYE